jgi:hypothetical protein
VKKEQVIDTDGKPLTKITYMHGTVEYYNNKGQFHRIGGPCYIHKNGYHTYWVNGKRHRTDGPAIIYTDGSSEYWVDDVEYTKEEYPQAVLAYKLKQLVG